MNIQYTILPRENAFLTYPTRISSTDDLMGKQFGKGPFANQNIYQVE